MQALLFDRPLSQTPTHRGPAEVEKLCRSLLLFLRVEDELVFEIEEGEIKKLSPKIKEIMEGILPHKDTHGVPIIAEGKIGGNWGNMKEI